MASTFKELSDDCRVRIRLYTERIQYTEDVFMRFFVEGLRKFQRETSLDEAVGTMTRTNGAYPLPADCFVVKDVQGDAKVSIVGNSPEQFLRTKQKSYSGEIPPLHEDRYRQWSVSKAYSPRRVYMVQDRLLTTFPDEGEATLTIYYIPMIEPFSKTSAQWAAWFVDDLAFETQLLTTSPNVVFAPYEDALVQYAVAQFLKADGNQSFALYEKTFWEEVEMAKNNKQQFFRRGYADIVYAPYK